MSDKVERFDPDSRRMRNPFTDKAAAYRELYEVARRLEERADALADAVEAWRSGSQITPDALFLAAAVYREAGQTQ